MAEDKKLDVQEISEEELVDISGGKVNIYNKTITPVKSWKKYKIKSGDTLSALALRYGVTIQTLKEKNKIVDVNKIQAGKEIDVPAMKY